MARQAVRYAVIDAFADTPFKGNPAAVCLLDGEDAEGGVDDQWMLRRFCRQPRFHLRWFTPVAEVKLCGHGTLAAAHFLLTSGLVECDVIEFITESGLLTAKKAHGLQHQGAPNISFNGTVEKYSIELDFPVVPVVGYESAEFPSIPETLNGVSIINVLKTTADDLIVELASGKEVADLQPNFAELEKCAGRGVIFTGLAPAGSGFDFFTRFFCPKDGVNEDPVCGSAHCALAPYWSKKLGKQSLVAYMASSRSGILDLQLEEKTQRVRIKGEAVTVMVGTILAWNQPSNVSIDL
uniref:Isomerase n=1 Tax=Ananas comosus var. bracteatus TaxID=296719 RepID=A0A6V7PG06_ANACO|nr:unnamed protein product [Ananas comosus var. bracteatus]